MSLGMVLEGGGMRGIYTAGVLDYFMERDFYPDGVVGVSAGACHGCSYVSKQLKRSYRINTGYSQDPRYMSLRSLLFTGDYFGADFAYHRIPDELEPYDFETFDRFKEKMPFYAVTTNVDTGKAEYFRIDDMKKEVDIVRASASLPLMSRIVGIKGKRLLDGGIADSIPIDFMSSKGYEKNIVVLTQPEGYRKGKNKLSGLIRLVYGKRYPKLAKAVEERHIVYNRTLDELRELEERGEVFIIKPSEFIPVSRVERDVKVLNRMYKLGYNDAVESFDSLLKFVQTQPRKV